MFKCIQSMILTVTANPLIDRTLVVDSLLPGKIIRADKTFEVAGGKGLNVSRMVKTLGEPVHALTFIGGGYGDRLKEILEKESIPSTAVRTLSPTRFQVSILDNKKQIHTDILDPGSVISKAECNAMVYEAERIISTHPDIDWVILSGSAPRGKVRNLYYDILQIANKYHIKTILDSYGDIFKQGLRGKPYCVKPNRDEAEGVMGHSLNSKVIILDFIKRMFDKGITLPILGLGKEGAIAGYQDKFYEIRPPKIKPLNVTGSGDAFVGTLAVSLLRGKSMEDSLRWAVAAGTANALVWKPCGCTLPYIKQVLPRVQLRTITG